MGQIIWEHAVLSVDVVQVKRGDVKWRAEAFVDTEQIYARDLGTMYWSAPLADMGRMGWELVGMFPETSLQSSNVKGWDEPIRRPMTTTFFFKRPAES